MYLSTKNTILKVYDGRWRDIFHVFLLKDVCFQGYALVHHRSVQYSAVQFGTEYCSSSEHKV